MENKLLKQLSRIKKELSKAGRIDLKDALSRDYPVQTQIKGNSAGCRLHLPLCFSGKTVRLKIINHTHTSERKN